MEIYYKSLTYLNKIYNKFTLLQHLLFTLIIAIIFCQIYKLFIPSNKEGFIDEGKKFITHSGMDIYDDYYANIYDQLVLSEYKNTYEISEIINITEPNTRSKILDIGSGTGHHVGELSKKNISVIGIDNSESMINASKENYPDCDFKKLDALSSMIFSANSFTHVLCLYFTIYYFKDKKVLFENSFNWLMPGGHLVVHLVDREKFDPILPAANNLHIVNPQDHAKERITNSTVIFDNFKYKANFNYQPSKNISTFLETFQNNDGGKIRQNEHTLYMPTQKEILAIAKSVGFILSSKIDLAVTQYEHQYLYVLQKPE